MLRRPASWWLSLALSLAVLQAFPGPASAGDPGAGGCGPPSDAGGSAGGRSLVVLSENVSLTLAAGSFETGLEPFPDLGTGLGELHSDRPFDLSGQLVDGNYTLLSYGGGREAARQNVGVAGHGEVVRWWFNGQEQLPLPVAFREAGMSGDAINGTFFIRGWVPGRGLAPVPGVYEMRFHFAGTRVRYPGIGEFQIYPPAELKVGVRVLFPSSARFSPLQAPADAGSTVRLGGEVFGSDGSRPSGKVLVTDGARTLGPPLPRGLFIDDVELSVAGVPHVVFRDGFEASGPAWSTGGFPDDWEAGAPPAEIGAFRGLSCLGTDLDGPYSHLADEWAQTPSLDASSFGTELTLACHLWTELAEGDRAELLVWNGTDWSDPLALDGPSATWRPFSLDLSLLTHRGRPLATLGSPELALRFRLRSSTPSALAAGGEFGLDWEIPPDEPAGARFLTLKFLPDGPFSASWAHLKVDVRGVLHFELPSAPIEALSDGWAEVRARLSDVSGQAPELPLGRDGGGYLEAFWDAGDGKLVEAESLAGVNLTGWFAAAHRLRPGELPGNGSFVLRFTGTERYRPVEARVACAVLGRPRIELEEPAPALRGGEAVVAGRVLLDGLPLAGLEVEVASPAPLPVEKVRTDGEGRFSSTVRVPLDWPAGSLEVRASTAPAGRLAGASSSVEVALKRVLGLKFEGASLEKGQPAAMVLDGLTFRGIAGRVLDEQGRPVPGVAVALEALRPGGEELLGRAITGPTGDFSVPFFVGWTEPSGRLVLRCRAGGGPGSVAKEATFSLTAGTVIELDPLPTLRTGGRAEVSGRLREDWGGRAGAPVAGQAVKVVLAGRTLDARTDLEGRFLVRGAVPDLPGNLTLEAAFEGDGALGRSSASTTALVLQDPGSGGGGEPLKLAVPVDYGTPAAAGSVAFAVLGAALIAGTEAGRYKLLLFIAPLYTKIRREAVLDQFVRGQVFGYIQANPGDHYSSIRQTLRLKNGTLAYHLRTLERESFIFSRMDGLYRRFYPSGADPSRIISRPSLRKTHRRILELIVQNPGITPKELAVKLGTSHQVASYHVRVLARKGQVRLEEVGRNTRCHPFGGAAGGSGP